MEAIGLPHETMSHEDIMKLTDGRGLVDLQLPLKPVTFKSLQGLPLGATSDDWQLTLAVAGSLLDRKSFDLLDIALRHVVEMKTRTPSWGRATKNAVQEIAEWFQSAGTSGRHPANVRTWLKDGSGGGNGVGMKIAPLAIFAAITESTDKQLAASCRELGQMTHNDPRAWLAAVALATAILECLRGESDPRVIVLRALEVVRQEEFRGDYDWRDVPKLSEAIEKILDSRATASAEALRKTAGVSCFAMESIPFVLGSFLRHPIDIRTGVLEVLNAGGDTDSNIGMYAALAGAFAGLESIPEEWRKNIPDSEVAVKIAKRFLGLVKFER